MPNASQSVSAASLQHEEGEYDWSVNFVLTFVRLNLDQFHDLTPSVEILFYASAASAEASQKSRELLIAALARTLNSQDVTVCLQSLQ
jgi:hypothetical protein